MASYPLLPREDFRLLRESWLGYVEVELRKEGIELLELPEGRRHCNCGKSRTSYPHWPPTCQSEAVDQLHCLVGESYPHRQYLAQCWMAFLLGKSTEDQTMISLVQKSCTVLALPKHEPPRCRRRKMDCEQICQPVLDANSCHCLCGCFTHREECPVHKLA
jgi:hypothetical protein